MGGTNGCLHMTGGTLRGNGSTENGGGVRLTGGSTFVINSGNIEGNVAASSGGGVHVVGSHFTMIDGNIFGNDATGNGGGVFATGPTTIANMQGGMIQENVAALDGGGLSVQGASTFIMTGGSVYKNQANNGGGVNVIGNNSAFEMQGGNIRENEAALLGGGFHVFGLGSLTMQQGEIAGNEAGNSGGGVNVQGGGTLFAMEGGEIYENASRNLGAAFGGGGANIASGIFVMHNGVIRNNHAESNGGGVRRGLLAVDAHFAMHGGTIRDNTAVGEGGGLFAQGEVYGPTLAATAYPRIVINPDGTFSGNRAGTGAFRPPDVTAITDRIATTSATIFHHPINNFDINFIYEPRITELTVTYETDARGSFNAPGAPDVRLETIQVDTALLPFLPQHVPTVTAAEGHAFTGWVRDGDSRLLTDAEVRALSITEDTRFIAQYADTSRLVSFHWNYNREDAIYLQQTIVHGEPVPRPPDPVRSGFVFQGWYLDPEGSLPHHFELSIVSNVSLYARWTPTQEPPQNEIHYAYLIGTKDGLIRPNGHITRAEVATIFFRLLSDENRAEMWSRENPFSDVTPHNWFNNAVSTTRNAGLFIGLPSGDFAPNRPITHAELVAVVARFTGVKDEALDLLSNVDNPITRAEAAAVINRMLNRLPEDSGDLLDGMRTWPDNANPDEWYYLYIQEASNSHIYARKADGIHESWVQLVTERPWALLERPDARPEDIFSRPTQAQKTRSHC